MGLSFLCGGLSALAFAPTFLFPLLWFSFPTLLWMAYSRTSIKHVAWLGWWFGLGHFGIGIYWITISLFTDLNQFAWLVPLAVPAIAGTLALYPTAALLLARLFPLNLTGFSLVFALCWISMEWLRSYLFTGFPWNLLGYSWAFSDTMLQFTSLVGIYGLSLFTILLVCLPTTFTSESKAHRILPTLSIVTIGIFIAVWGHVRLTNAPFTDNTNVKLRIIQANIPQDMKWQPGSRFASFQKHIYMSLTDGHDTITHFIWPESAIPYTLDSSSPALEFIRETFTNKAIILSGALRQNTQGMTPQIWNSLFAIQTSGHIITAYDKVHLVPFGEYIPFRSILPLEKITYGSLDFSSGTPGQTLALPNTPPIIPLICYEAIFPQHITPQTPQSWMLNITNDAWFGHSSGPYQHLHMVRVRSIEQGIPLIRAANTGISAVIDSYGRVIHHLQLGTEGIIDSTLPKALPTKTTYSKYKNYIILLIIYFFGSLLLIFKRTFVKKSN